MAAFFKSAKLAEEDCSDRKPSSDNRNKLSVSRSHRVTCESPA